MNLFQGVVLILAGTLFALSIVAASKGWATRREGCIAAAIWLAAAVAVLWPDLTTRIARVFGLGRGANLLLYCAVIGMTVGFFMVYIRLRQVRRDLTLLVRHLAIVEVHEATPSQDSASTPAAKGQSSDRS